MTTIFLLYEHFTGTISGRDSTLLDIYTDFKKAEDARVGLNTWKEHAWIEYEVVQWEIRE